MPSTQEKKIISERGFSTCGAGGEPTGEPPAVCRARTLRSEV